MTDLTPDPPEQTAATDTIVVHVDAILERLLPKFLARRRQDVTFIIEELEREGFAALEKLGHNLKGTGRGYGLDGISEIGAVLERAAQNRDAEVIRAQATALDDYLTRVRVAPAHQPPSP